MSKINNEAFVTLGKLGSTHGVRGWIKVYSETSLPADIFNFPTWLLKHPFRNNEQTVKHTDYKKSGGKLITKLEGIDTPEEAKQLTGMLIQIPKDDLPTLNDQEYYWADLVGLEIIDQHGKSLGRVSHLIETGSNDVLVVKGEKEHAIPYLPDVILKVDLENKTITVDWEVI